MKQIYLYVRFLLLSGLALIIFSCTLLSVENLSNDFKWKKKKFKQPVGVNFQFQPLILSKIHKKVWFYDVEDSIGAEKKYRVKELLEKKLRKRNIDVGSENQITIRIDTLLFEEHAEVVSVNQNSDSSYLEDSTKDTFLFKITGSLVRNDSVLAKLETVHEHSNEPRESYMISGTVVMGGGGARADRMIENTINEFSYRIYEQLKLLQK